MCEEPIERLYYSAKYPRIVFYACSLEIDVDTDNALYPQCSGCQKPKIPVMMIKHLYCCVCFFCSYYYTCNILMNYVVKFLRVFKA